MKSPRFFLFQRIFLPSGLAALAFILLHLPACEDEHVRRDYPRVRTLEVINITEDGATFVGEVYEEGNVEITEHGFTWALSRPEVTADERVLLGSFSGTGRYDAEISTALEEGITYQVCAFVKAGDYTVYGDTVKFMSLGSGAPEITDFMPKSAGWGDTVTITGRRFSHLNATNRIQIEDLTIFPVYSSDTLLKFILQPTVSKPLNALSVSILGNVATAIDKLTFIPPAVNGFYPESGFWGDTITFAGSCLNFFGAMQSDGVILNDFLLRNVIKVNDKSLSFIIPDQLNTVSSPVSLSYRTFLFSFPENFTLITTEADSISPADGTWGTLVTLYGKFNSITERNKVQFGDMQASIVSSSRDSLVVRVPDNLSEYVTLIRYYSDPFTNVFSESFRLKEPEIFDFEPKQGHAGNIITIKGRYFRKGVTTVKFGDTNAIIQSQSSNDTVINCFVPGNIYGEYTLSVSLTGHTAVADELFNVTNPVITGVTPLDVSYGDTVTINGFNLYSGLDVRLGPTYFVDYIRVSDQEIKFAVPVWMNYNPTLVWVVYSFQNGGLLATSIFTYPEQLKLEDFTITDVTPLSGETGDLIIIKGTNFGNPGVTFGSVGGEVIESTSEQITVKVPVLSSGDHTVGVTIGGRTHYYPYKYTHTGPWRRLDDLPFLYEYACVFDFGEEAYVATAGETGMYEKEIYRFNPSVSGFDRLPVTCLSTVLNPASCTLNGKGYVIGQRSTYHTGIGFEVFNPDSLTWRLLPDYPGTGIVNPCIIADDSVIYAGCGKIEEPSSFVWYRDFWKYSPATNSWTQLADCPQNVSFSNHVFIDGRLLFVGFVGTTGPRYLLEYKPLSNTWDQVEITDENLGYWGLWDFKNGAKVSVVNNGKWYLGFGDWYQANYDSSYERTNPDVNNRFYSFDPSDNSWKTISNVAAPPRTFPLAFSYGGKVYIGGSQVFHYYDFWEYDPQLDQ